MADKQWSSGRRAGFFLGGCLAALVPILLSVEALFHAGDLVHAAQKVTGVEVIHTLPRTPFSFHEQRRMESEGEGDPEEDDADDEDSLTWLLVDLLGRLIIFATICISELITLYVYWNKYIKPTHDSYLRPRTVVPQDLQGKWHFGVFDCGSDLGTCCCFTLCPACTSADLWYRAGMIHAVAGDGSNSVVGWQWFVGIFGWCLIVDSGFEPCVFGIIRGGLGWLTGSDEMGGPIPLRKRFNIPHNGFSTFLEDCCLACWCFPCVGTQEFRQVKMVLDQNPQEAPATAVAVGQAPQALVVGVPVSTNEK